MKQAPGFGGAFGPDVTAHQLGNFFADRQPEARAAEHSGYGPVGLMEGVENEGQL